MYIFRILGCCKCKCNFISVATCLSILSARILSLLSTLIAKTIPVSLKTAIKTSPNLPLPNLLPKTKSSFPPLPYLPSNLAPPYFKTCWLEHLLTPKFRDFRVFELWAYLHFWVWRGEEIQERESEVLQLFYEKSECLWFLLGFFPGVGSFQPEIGFKLALMLLHELIFEILFIEFFEF